MPEDEEIRFRAPTRGSWPWTTDGSSITSAENLAKIRHVLERVGSIVIQHYHFYGARRRDTVAFDEFDDFVDYLKEKAIAGDAIDVWCVEDHCLPTNRLAEGKCPDEDGKVPRGGAY